jgi:hypothetical protein
MDGHVELMRMMRNAYLTGKPEWVRPLGNLVIAGIVILEWILKKEGGKVRTGFNLLRIATSGGVCEHGSEPSGSIKHRI